MGPAAEIRGRTSVDELVTHSRAVGIYWQDIASYLASYIHKVQFKNELTHTIARAWDSQIPVALSAIAIS